MTGDIILATMHMAAVMAVEIGNQIEIATKARQLRELANEEPFIIYLQYPSVMNEMSDEEIDQLENKSAYKYSAV